jgi:SAM-dependent methyltransferase
MIRGESLRKKLVSQVARRLPPGIKELVAARFKNTIDWVRGDERDAIGAKYLAGNGLEIGALTAPLRVPRSARVKYVDRMSADDLRRQYPELRTQRIVSTDIISDGERLEAVPDASQDFVIANHFIEHCQNPIFAILNMFRVLKPGGVLYLAIPDKRYTFDRDRPVVFIDHLIRDYEEGPEWSKRQHFEEWVRLVERVDDSAAVQRQVEQLIASDYSIHFHVWSQLEMEEFLLVLRKRFGCAFDVLTFLKHYNECIFVLRKA